MKTLYEKEKKLNEAIKKLNFLNPENPNLTETIRKMDGQKNQLEIEKKDLELKYEELKEEFRKIKLKLDEMNHQKNKEHKKEIEFS